MPVSSLTKMTVPLASDQSASTQGLLMPKLKYRFRAVFENFGTLNSATPVTEMTKQVMDFTRPTVTFEDILIPIYNSTVKLAGKPSWGEVTINLRDDAGGNVTKLVGQQLQKQFDFMEMASASSGIDYKFFTKLQVLDGGNGAAEPRVLETWEIYGCYLKSVNYGEANYGSNEPMTIALTMMFDNANQADNEGVGSAVGRTLGDVVTGPATPA